MCFVPLMQEREMQQISFRTRGQLPEVNFTANKQDLLLSYLPKIGCKMFHPLSNFSKSLKCI